MVDLNKTDNEYQSKLKDLRRQIAQMTIRTLPSFWGGLVIIGAPFIAYAIAYILTDRYFGQAIGILAIVPVIIAAWFLGQHLGSMAALLIFPVNMILLLILGQPLSTLLQASNLALMASLVLIASVVGRQQHLVDQLRLGLKGSLKGEMEFWGSRERYQALDTAFTGIAVTDSIERLMYCNATLADMLGYVPDEFEDKFLDQFMEPSEISKFRENINLMKKGIPTKYEVSMRRKDGDHLTMLFSSIPRFAVDGSYEGILSVIIDITERVRFENDLKQSEERFRELIEKAGIGISIDDVEGNLVYINQTFADIHGYTIEEIHEKPFQSLTHPDDIERVLGYHVARIQGQEAPSRYEYRGVRKDGSIIHLEVNVVRLEEGGRTTGTRTYLWDISERKHAEVALKEGDERFRRMSEVALEGILIHDKGNIIDVNAAFADMFGYSPSELIGMNALDFATEELREKASQAISTGSEEIYIGRAIRKDGSTFQVEVQGRNIPFEGKMIRAVVVREITERRRMEEALRKSQEEAVRGQSLLIALNQAAQAVQRARTKEEIYHTVGDEIARLGFQTGIFTITEDRTHLRLSYLRYEPKFIKTAEKLTGFSAQDYQFQIKEGGLFDRLINEGKTIFISEGIDYLSEGLPKPIRTMSKQVAKILDIKQAIFAPLKYGGTINNLLFVTGSNLVESDAIAITAFGNQTAIALENSALFNQANTD